jgi:hypothetical protein
MQWCFFSLHLPHCHTSLLLETNLIWMSNVTLGLDTTLALALIIDVPLLALAHVIDVPPLALALVIIVALLLLSCHC